jgi:hypothetical protein
VIASRPLGRSREGRLSLSGLDLQDWAAWATIVGTVIVVTTTILGWLGKLRVRLPANLNSLERRAVFILTMAVVPLPIWAWGPTWGGLLASLANLMILPWMPGYIQRRRSVPTGEKAQAAIPGVLYWVTVLLVIMNVVALGSALFPEANIGSYEVRNRIAAAKDCTAANREFELALANYKRARGLHDEDRMKEESEYMRLAERRMRQLSCPQTATLPSV